MEIIYEKKINLSLVLSALGCVAMTNVSGMESSNQLDKAKPGFPGEIVGIIQSYLLDKEQTKVMQVSKLFYKSTLLLHQYYNNNAKKIMDNYKVGTQNNDANFLVIVESFLHKDKKLIEGVYKSNLVIPLSEALTDPAMSRLYYPYAFRHVFGEDIFNRIRQKSTIETFMDDMMVPPCIFNGVEFPCMVKMPQLLRAIIDDQDFLMSIVRKNKKIQCKKLYQIKSNEKLIFQFDLDKFGFKSFELKKNQSLKIDLEKMKFDVENIKGIIGQHPSSQTKEEKDDQ